MFKNAGTTFDWSLERNFSSGFVDHREDDRMRNEGTEYLSEYLLNNTAVNALSSHHLCSPLPTINEIDLLPVFLIRHPIERIWSVYNFERQQISDTPGAVNVKALGFRDYVKWRMEPGVNPTIGNFQTRYCLGIATRPEIVETNEHLMSAKEKLGATEFVGVVDRYDESMVLFEEKYKQQGLEVNLQYIQQNITLSNEGKRLEFDDKLRSVIDGLGETYQEVEEKNALDIELYRYANHLLTERLSESSIDKDSAVFQFRERCKALG